jgi:hypothetical protein
MSRLLIAFSIVASLGSLASADRISTPPQRFAQPPSEGRVEPAPVAPHVVAPRPRFDRATLRAKLAEQRAANLARFRAYQQKGVFPSNTFKPGKLNVWLDNDGHYCAAATIIRMSGQVELVDKVAEQNNFIRLIDVKQGPLMQWILTSGFTQEEIAAIQEPMDIVTDDPSLDPAEPARVNPRMRMVENQRLIKKYKDVDAMLVKNARASLDVAVDRLMKHQELAWQFSY